MDVPAFWRAVDLPPAVDLVLLLALSIVAGLLADRIRAHRRTRAWRDRAMLEMHRLQAENHELRQRLIALEASDFNQRRDVLSA